MKLNLIHEKADETAQFLKAMSNPRRLQVLCTLSEGEKSVGELEKMVGISQSALSQHLARLREENMVETRREAQTIYYSLSSPTVASLLHYLQTIMSSTPV